MGAQHRHCLLFLLFFLLLLLLRLLLLLCLLFLLLFLLFLLVQVQAQELVLVQASVSQYRCWYWH
jgi:hypothetical protein